MNKYDKLDDLRAALSVIDDKLRKKFYTMGARMWMIAERESKIKEIKKLEKKLNVTR